MKAWWWGERARTLALRLDVRHPKTFLWGLVLLGITCPRNSSAQSVPGYAADHFQPSERGSDFFAAESLDFHGNGRMALGTIVSYSNRVLTFRDGPKPEPLLKHQILAHLGASVFLADRFRLALNLPVSLFSDGQNVQRGSFTFVAPSPTGSVGDARLAFDGRLFGKHDDLLTGAMGAQLFVPSGSEGGFTGWGAVRARPRFMLAGRRGDLEYAGHIGVVFSGRGENYNIGRIGSEVTAGVSAAHRFLADRLLVGPEILFASTVERFIEKSTTPVEGLFGGHYVVGDFRLGAGVGAGLSRGYGAPTARGILSFEWLPEASVPVPWGSARDGDGDGVPDGLDACLYVPGQPSDAPDANGCPAPDFDKDGVPDDQDVCPGKSGFDSEPHRRGCPSDHDGDGISDHDDACPSAPGTRSPDRARHGCPSLKDSDDDGVPDVEDICPYAPGMRSLDPRASGCPVAALSDGDGDGIWDHDDACPDVHGKASSAREKNGCPENPFALATIQFATDSAILEPTKENERSLSLALEVMRTHPEIKRVVVEGHTDRRGPPQENVKLSQARAEAVVAWLVAHGVDKARLESKGVGGDRPIATNDTEQGRAANRRIEFRVFSSMARGAPTLPLPASKGSVPSTNPRR